MKQCTQCGRAYSDETLNFCLDDGSPLTNADISEEPRTIFLGSPRQAETDPVRSHSFSRSNSIAVLPFANMSDDASNEYFCDGLAEELLNALAKIEDLKVAARTSSFAFKDRNIDVSEIGRALHVNTVLEGSVRKAGDRVRIVVQLINVSDGYHLWSDRYDRELKDIFDVQDEITLAVVEALKVRLLGGEKDAVFRRYTDNTEAYQLYLAGRYFWNKRTPEAFAKAVEYFEKAIAIEPNYAPAYSGIADCYNSLGFSFDLGLLPAKEAIPKAKAAAFRALDLDPTLAEAHTSLAYAMQLFDWDWAGSEREFKLALELNPNYANAHHWYSHFLTAMGRTEESLVQSMRALELDPISIVMNTHLGWHYFFARDFDSVIEQLGKTNLLDPNYGLARWYLALAFEQKQMYREAAAEFQKATDLLNGDLVIPADLAHLHAVSGLADLARNEIDSLRKASEKNFVPFFGMALIHVGLGDYDEAFECLDRALEERSDMLVYLNVDPRVDPLRNDPRFENLLSRVGLPA